MPPSRSNSPPILSRKHYDVPSAFTPEGLLREARRQKGLSVDAVPQLCILDPDGDIVRHLLAAGRARRHPAWACYHTDLYAFDHEGLQYGIIGCAVGAAFAVLVAEELFASGCQFLVSMTSAGQILPIQPPPYFVVIDRALRDEGTSYHYLPPSDYSEADAELVRHAQHALAGAKIAAQVGSTWTTDAPFRETQEAIEAAIQAGILAVEMEAAALYALAKARGRQVLCFAHVTNQMARIDGDFEKGSTDGAEESLKVIALQSLDCVDTNRDEFSFNEPAARHFARKAAWLHLEVCSPWNSGREGKLHGHRSVTAGRDLAYASPSDALLD